MLFENSDPQEETYLAFYAGSLGCLMPLPDVGQMVADIPQGVPALALDGQKPQRSCAVLFQDEQGLAALVIGKVVGLVQLPSSCQFEMPAAAKSPRNSWIAGVAYLKSEGGLYYLLDCRSLRARFAGVQP